MEFYPAAQACGCGATAFQFPTGWNSTQQTKTSTLQRLDRFNSQRDEILHVFAAFIILDIFVSIPNGMKFYHLLSFSLRLKYVVSIPNGMKFYFTEIYEVATGKDSFNSQRDEILLNDGWQATLFAKFQFPTG